MVNKKKICAGCNISSYIYKNIEGKKYCKFCAYKINPPVKPKKISEKKKQEDVEYSKLRKLYLESHSFCEAKLPGICTNQATDIHHMSGKIGEKYLDITNFIALCRMCHNWCEMHPIDAKELGLSKNRL